MERSTSTTPGTSPDTGVSQDNHSITSSTGLSPSTGDVLAEAFRQDTFPRFLLLFRHAKTLIELHGPYTCSKSAIFQRAKKAPSKQKSPIEVLATSLAAAQDSIHTLQPAGPAKTELQLFRLLWDATTDVLQKVLEEGNLDHEVYGWGVFGLAAGYMESPTTAFRGRENFATYKERLHSALESLPSLNSSPSSRGSGVAPGQRVHLLTKARREVHVCSNLLIEHFKQEGWMNVRWYHGCSVAEKWIGTSS